LNEIFLRAPATIANVGPGFDIFAFSLAHPYDLFRVALAPAPSDISIRCHGGEGFVPVDADRNTAGLTAKYLLAKYGLSTGLVFEIHKRMPSCSGLGSSAASAAACAVGLDRLLKIGCGEAGLIEAASQGEIASGGTPHADNAAGCLLGGFIFVRSFRPVDVVRLPLPDIPVVIRVQRKPHITSRGQIAASYSLDDIKRQMAQCADVIRAVAGADVEAFGRAINLDLISEPVRSRAVPGYDELKKSVLDAGAWGCNVCGGGSSVFALAPPGRTQEIATLMRAVPLPDGQSPEVIITTTSNQGVEVIDGL